MIEVTKIEVNEIEKKLVVKHGDAPQINFGADFESLCEIHQTIYLKKLTSSLNHALDLIQRERNDLLAESVTMRKQLRSAESQSEIQKNIVIKIITDSNADHQRMSAQIQDLTHRVEVQNKVIESQKVG
tara:strand:- start:165 stop:551 length:387 start_codon:yes stop_codon:yes gene_type:complete